MRRLVRSWISKDRLWKGKSTSTLSTRAFELAPPRLSTLQATKRREDYSAAFNGHRWYTATNIPCQQETMFNNSTPGHDLYQQAVDKIKLLESIQEEKEQEKNRKMFEAWKSAQEKAEGSQKSKGVQVVQTLVKEVRKEKQKQQAQVDEEVQIQKDIMDLLEEAAQKHEHPLALVKLGELAMERAKSMDSESDVDAQKAELALAVQLLERAGQAGSHLGWFQLGQLLFTGFPEASEDTDTTTQVLKPNLHEAMEAFVHAIDLGDHDAMYLVGIHRMTAGGRENIHSGLNLVRKAAEGGHGSALYYLALLHLNGEPNIGLEPCEESEFVERLDRAAASGNTDALFTRGHSYYHGTEGYPQQPSRALDDFLKAADGGHADAAVSAGAILFHGVGVSQDQRRAFELYQAAGEMGSQEGWRNVVACYTHGEGVPQSLETAKYIASVMLQDDESSDSH